MGIYSTYTERRSFAKGLEEAEKDMERLLEEISNY